MIRTPLIILKCPKAMFQTTVLSGLFSSRHCWQGLVLSVYRNMGR